MLYPYSNGRTQRTNCFKCLGPAYQISHPYLRLRPPNSRTPTHSYSSVTLVPWVCSSQARISSAYGAQPEQLGLPTTAGVKVALPKRCDAYETCAEGWRAVVSEGMEEYPPTEGWRAEDAVVGLVDCGSCRFLPGICCCGSGVLVRHWHLWCG